MGVQYFRIKIDRKCGIWNKVYSPTLSSGELFSFVCWKHTHKHTHPCLYQHTANILSACLSFVPNTVSVIIYNTVHHQGNRELYSGVWC